MPPSSDERRERDRNFRRYFGVPAAAVAVLVTHPIDMVKVHVQTSYGARQMQEFFTRVYRNDGLRGLYRGKSASVTRQLAYSVTHHGVYDQSRRSGQRLSFEQVCATAGLAGAAGGFVGAPAELVNVRMEDDMKKINSKRRNYSSVVDGIRTVFKKEGVLGCFKGASVATLETMLTTVSQLAFYHTYKNILLSSGWKDSSPARFICALAAGMTGTAMTHPLDVVKTLAMSAKPGQFPGVLEVVLHLARIGPWAFYKGIAPALIRINALNVLTFVFVDQLSGIL